MSKSTTIAILFIALGAYSHCATAETVYKCGNAYSQTPCADGKALTVDDTRDPAQKMQAEEATRRDVSLAATMAQERLAQEKKIASAPRARKPAAKASAASEVDTQPVTSHKKLTAKRVTRKDKKQENFVAEVPGTGKKPAHKKTTGKKKDSPPV